MFVIAFIVGSVSVLSVIADETKKTDLLSHNRPNRLTQC